MYYICVTERLHSPFNRIVEERKRFGDEWPISEELHVDPKHYLEKERIKLENNKIREQK